MDPEIDFEAQDLAETFDETNLTEDGGEIANFDEIGDVYDVTVSDEDDDLDDEHSQLDAADFDEDAIDYDILDAMRDDEGDEMDNDQLNAPGRRDVLDADQVSTTAEEPASFESEMLDDDEIEALGYGDAREKSDADRHVEKQLDHGLKETFPASDPVSINPGAD